MVTRNRLLIGLSRRIALMDGDWITFSLASRANEPEKPVDLQVSLTRDLAIDLDDCSSTSRTNVSWMKPSLNPSQQSARSSAVPNAMNSSILNISVDSITFYSKVFDSTKAMKYEDRSRRSLNQLDLSSSNVLKRSSNRSYWIVPIYSVWISVGLTFFFLSTSMPWNITFKSTVKHIWTIILVQWKAPRQRPSCTFVNVSFRFVRNRFRFSSPSSVCRSTTNICLNISSKITWRNLKTCNRPLRRHSLSIVYVSFRCYSSLFKQNRTRTMLNCCSVRSSSETRSDEWVLVLGTIRLACSLAVHYERQRGSVEDGQKLGKQAEHSMTNDRWHGLSSRPCFRICQPCSDINLWERYQWFSFIPRSIGHVNLHRHRSDQPIA